VMAVRVVTGQDERGSRVPRRWTLT
jgi:hypothetical protein